MKSSVPSPRQNKKIRTRKAIIESAYALFKKDGYQKTTIADIAGNATIAPRTFFSYFSSKEDVLFVEISDIERDLEISLRNRKPSNTALDVLHAWIIAQVRQFTQQDAHIHQLRCKIIASQISLQAREKFYFSQIEVLLKREIAQDLDVKEDNLIPAITASASRAALEIAYDHARKNPVNKKTANELIAIADQSMLFLRGGIATTKVDH
jgi:AcrR family transcriptional regulator